MSRKLAILGAGNAGCISALHFQYYCSHLFDEISIFHSSEEEIMRVGQGTVIPSTRLIGDVLGINWHNNQIGATIKTGIMYENWGEKTQKIFHGFPLNQIAIHYVPKKLSEAVLNSGNFNVINKKINDPEKEIDADFIIDCRGKKYQDTNNYTDLKSPLNSVLLCNKKSPNLELNYTKHVATPHGWTFIIPNIDSVSYGYLYNDKITTKNEATEDFLERFNLPEVDGELSFQNYTAKNYFIGERTMLNGNSGFFLEPMEANSVDFFHRICQYGWDHFIDGVDKHECNTNILNLAKRIEHFILWHYQSGSIYNTPFWDYVKSIPFEDDEEFQQCINMSRIMSYQKLAKGSLIYGNWDCRSFKIWDNNV
jgi:hypothetical protein